MWLAYIARGLERQETIIIIVAVGHIYTRFTGISSCNARIYKEMRKEKM